MRPLTLPPARIGTSSLADQTDAPAEIRQDILVQPEAEREDVVALEKERPLLREEQRESRQVRPPRVDFGLGEVGVDRADASTLAPSRWVTSRLG